LQRCQEQKWSMRPARGAVWRKRSLWGNSWNC